ncbi:hypothetical protein P8A24_07095 [Arcanobacterium wilhelmae]|uniref:hypothetical protein n=1 Tax=Arcanobacterium wilhelmae TaxID=1803177 RepID=UPI0024151EA3|nr:hypothetical protein [Arcanobacterium wilhelmae]WFN89954.1 hypothetical protein P8A24_07095 [Arcanobacterium wilhelmae]
MSVLLLVNPDFEEQLLYALGQRRTDHYIVRRCADLTELLATASAGVGGAALIDGDLESLSLTAVKELQSLGLQVGLIGGKQPAQYLRNMSAQVISPSEAVAWIESVGELERPSAPAPASGSGVIVAVWGPPGSHGRSTIARELARLSGGVVVDLDLVAPSLAQMCAVEESSALVAFARNVEKGRDVEAAADLLVETDSSGTRVIAGLNSAARWREISAPVVEKIVETLRMRESWIFLDLAGGFSGSDAMRDRWNVTRRVIEGPMWCSM